MSDEAIVITGDGIEAARLITLRMALRTEILTGMKRSNRGRPTLELVNEAMGFPLGSKGYFSRKRAAYTYFDQWLAARYPGLIEPKPLPS